METFRDAMGRLLVPTGRFLAASGIHPHLISMSGIAFGASSAWAFMTGRLWLGVAFFTLSGLADAVDGIVARLRGQQSPFGSFMDNFCSAYTDSAALAGLILANLCSPLWGLLALLGTYARLLTFRLDGLVPAEEGQALKSRFPHALAGKGDRIALVGLGVLFGRINTAMVVIALATNIIAVYRTWHLWKAGTPSPAPQTAALIDGVVS